MAIGPTPDWYPDPGGELGRERWWDGEAWTSKTTECSAVDAAVEAGWYDDPGGSGGQRRWDGTSWTTERRGGADPSPITERKQTSASRRDEPVGVEASGAEVQDAKSAAAIPTLKLGDWAKVVAENDDHAGRSGKIVKVCDDGDEYDYCLRFQGDPEPYAFRRDELVRAPAVRLKRQAPVKVQDANARKPPIGWYPDPKNPGIMRFWDGSQWTESRSPMAAEQDDAKTLRTIKLLLAVILIVIVGYLVINKPWESDGYKACVAEQKLAAGDARANELEPDIEKYCHSHYG